MNLQGKYCPVCDFSPGPVSGSGAGGEGSIRIRIMVVPGKRTRGSQEPRNLFAGTALKC